MAARFAFYDDRLDEAWSGFSVDAVAGRARRRHGPRARAALPGRGRRAQRSLPRGDGVRRPGVAGRRGVRPRRAHVLVHHRAGRAGRGRPRTGPGPSRRAARRRPRSAGTRATGSGTWCCSARRCSAPATRRAPARRWAGSATYEREPRLRRPDRQPVARRPGHRPGGARPPRRGRRGARRGARRAVADRDGTDGVAAQLDRAEAQLLIAPLRPRRRRGRCWTASAKAAAELGMRIDVGRALVTRAHLERRRRRAAAARAALQEALRAVRARCTPTPGPTQVRAELMPGKCRLRAPTPLPRPAHRRRGPGGPRGGRRARATARSPSAPTSASRPSRPRSPGSTASSTSARAPSWPTLLVPAPPSDVDKGFPPIGGVRAVPRFGAVVRRTRSTAAFHTRHPQGRIR